MSLFALASRPMVYRRLSITSIIAFRNESIGMAHPALQLDLNIMCARAGRLRV